MGLYDDENVGITDGAYASLYRAAMGNEKDQAKLQELKDTQLPDQKPSISGS